ncbi:MAG: hypothetical protein ACK4V6_17690 [Microthrixaceae bacterium]
MVLALVGVMAVVGGCTGDDGIDVVVGEEEVDAMGLASENAFAADRLVLGDGSMGELSLEVEYFEPVRKGEWVAPPECAYSTRVSVNGDLTTDGFDGPRSNDDREAGEGALAGSIATTVATPVATPVAPVTEPGSDPSPEPGPSAGELVPEPGVGEPVPEPRAGAPEPPGPGYQDAILALVVAYGHDQVVELSTDHPAAIDGRGLEAQPLDGWNVLSVAVDPAATEDGPLDVTLRRVHEDGTETTEQLAVALDDHRLELLTDRWRFDAAGVGEQCRPPGGTASNEPLAPDRDLLGSPVGDAPELPAPGAAPADPTAAADEALRAIRTMYDLSDLYAASKRDRIERPEAWDVMREELLRNDVVAPYMSNLDPEFRSSVFVSPTEVHVIYRVGPSYQWEIGRVLLIDGTWRVAMGTFCRDLSAAGYRCADVVNDPRPGPLG